ncbi:hypothetical protein BDV09DRAFT_190710 [Aspergillus tetrazonus]
MSQHRPRKKACDLCYRKKIKCDAQRPRCSHCVVYDSSCTFEAAIRKRPARKQALNSEQPQIKQLQENLRQALAKIDQLESNVPIPSHSPRILASLQEPEEEERGEILDFVDGSSPLDLPPLHEALPAVEQYLATLNSVIPLFHPSRLKNSLRNLYAARAQRHCSTWAAINMVLALTYSSHAPSDRQKAAHYLNRSQAILTEIIMGEAAIINVQILLGLAMLFQGARNLKPAAMITAIALHLAHELGLHARSQSEGLNTSATLERNHVFWIAYIINRDISMRTGQPPVQLEADIDIELPPADPEDRSRLVFAADHSSHFNFFCARKSMYSVRAQSLDIQQRNENLAELFPSQFQLNTVLRTCGPDSLRSFGILYSTHLSCRALICRAHAMETHWLQSLQEFGEKSLQQHTTEPVVLPQGWQVLVNESREYMRLFLGVERKDPAFIWMTGCTYVTGSVCLIANNILFPNHKTWRYDQSLAECSLPLLEEMIQQDPYEPLKKIQNTCRQLLQLAYNISLQNDFLHF